MRKIFALIVSSLLALCLLAGCTAKTAETSANADVSEIKTLKDAYDYEMISYGYRNNYFTYAFVKDGVDYRAVAEITDEMTDKLLEIDFGEDHDAGVKEIVADLPVIFVENMDESQLTDEQMASYVGKSGKDLADAGWRVYSYSEGDMIFDMSYGVHVYKVEFDGVFPAGDEFIDEEDIADFTVKSVTYLGIGEVNYGDDVI
ncbi:hypothetical protein SAMN02910456_00916 [Ruminococcaceae bacterium YRB3002]|nr:hypothetical protein SAMN02910456_00916 [Ruminococcaceae bacterium YRB3002]